MTKQGTSSNDPSTLNHYNTYNKYSVSDHNIRKFETGFSGIGLPDIKAVYYQLVYCTALGFQNITAYN